MAVIDAAERLVGAGRELRARATDDLVDVLAGWIDTWSEPGSDWADRLAGALAPAAGFHESTVREGLARGLGAWRSDDLRRVVADELGGRDHSTVSGFDCTALVLAGSIPMPSLLALVWPLLLRSPVLVKCAARDPVTARIAAETLGEIDPLLGRCVEPLHFDRGDAASLDAFLGRADCVVATGSDAAVAALAARVAPPRRFVGFGHRASVAVLGPEADPAEAARDLAVDVALWDQLGCLSPVAVYCLGADADARSVEIGRRLASELAGAERHWPRGEVGVEAAALAAGERAEAEVRAAAGADVHVWGGVGDPWCVIREADLTARPAPLHRFVRVHAARDERILIDALGPLARHLAGVALAGCDGHGPALAARLAELGASRVCAPGRLQCPPLDWHHDGQRLLGPIARWSDLELEQ